MRLNKHSLLVVTGILFGMAVSAAQPCRLEIVEQGSGWPVPMVELCTTHHACFVSDNAGVIAFDLPELMGKETWFEVKGYGYEVPKDGLDCRGVRLTPEPGKAIRVEVSRKNVARRIGRVTGAGLFAESQKTGRENKWKESGVFGCDSILNVVYEGRLFWFWGDTILANYPLGIFDATGATTSSQPLNSFEPPLRLKLNYFAGENGVARAVAKMPGQGPTWLSGCLSLTNREGKERLVASFCKVTAPLAVREWGLCVWNDDLRCFEPFRLLWTKSEALPEPPPIPSGHPILWKDEQGKEWALFGNPFPTLRCPATFESWQNPAAWEVLKPQESLRSAFDNSEVKPHSGCIAWNFWRKRWVTIFMERLGNPSAYGELWYAEAKTPTGPWGRAVKVVSHENYTFYNPSLHPEFTLAGSHVLFFEGTFTTQFANHAEALPRYDYNQVLYRLDLDDRALAPAQEP